MMNPKLLAYLLKETETAIRIMSRDDSNHHAFDIGVNEKTGEMLSMLMVVAPVDQVDAWMEKIGKKLVDSKPSETGPGEVV